MEPMSVPNQPINSSRFMLKFFDANATELPISSEWVVSVDYFLSSAENKLTIELIPNVLIQQEWLASLSFLKVFFLNEATEVAHSQIFSVKSYEMRTRTDYESGGPLTYKLKLKV